MFATAVTYDMGRLPPIQVTVAEKESNFPRQQMDSAKGKLPSQLGFAVTAPYSVQQLKLQNRSRIKLSCLSETEDKLADAATRITKVSTSFTPSSDPLL